MFSVEAEARKEKREAERREREELALKKDDVRRKVKKYDRLHGQTKPKVRDGTKTLKHMLRKSDRQADRASKTAARLELLLQDEPGYLKAGGVERTCRYRQEEISAAVPLLNQQHFFDLQLERLGPYSIDYSRNGRFLLIGGSKGHIATMDWKDKQLGCEFHVRETVRDVQFLHNEMLFAVAQKRYLYVYDHTGMELHCLKQQSHVNRLAFLPYHFLLVSADDHGTLRYLDTSIGQPVVEMRTKMGTLKTIAYNPRNAVVQLGHYNGTVTMWTPNMHAPVVKMQCHRGQVTGLAVDHGGYYLATAAIDARVKIWDIRTYRPLHTYPFRQQVASLDISQRGLLAVGRGRVVEVWQDALMRKQRTPYLRHRVASETAALRFCPFEDCLGIGHGRGFSSMIVPGSGEPNFDALEVNPNQSKVQRQEMEVKQLLEKVPAELISLDPDCLSRVGEEDKAEDEEGSRVRTQKAKGIKKQKMKEERGRAEREQQVHQKVKQQKEMRLEGRGEGSAAGTANTTVKKKHILDRFR